MWQRIAAAATFLKARIQRNVSIPTKAYGPSKPGEYPHLVRGILRKSVFYRPRRKDMAADVGTKLVYGIHWELTNRPYIRRTLAEELGTIRGILEGTVVRTIEDVRADAAEAREARIASGQRARERRQARSEKRRERKWLKGVREKEKQAKTERWLKRLTPGKRKEMQERMKRTKERKRTEAKQRKGKSP